MPGPLPLGLLALLLAAASAALIVSWVGERRQRRHLKQQLEMLAAGQAAVARTEQMVIREPGAGGVRGRLGEWMVRLLPAERLLEQSGVTWTREVLLRLSLGSAGLTAGLVVLGGWSPMMVAAAALVGGLLPLTYLSRARARRLRAFEAQLPEAIDLLSRAIRAGHAVSTGLRVVAEESPEPLRTEFRRVFDEQRYGLPFEDSFLSLARRVDLVDLRVMVVAILVQREVGGNLAEVLDKIASLIRTRFALRRQIRVYTAQGRMSAWVLGLLPLMVGLALFLMSPDYLATLLVEPAGRLMLAFALMLQLAGYVWIWKIVRVPY